MARKRTLNRRDLRDQAEAAETREKDDEAEEEADEEEASDDEGDEEAPKPKPKKKPAAKKPAAPKRSRVKEPPRMRAVWVVFDNGGKKIETFPYPQKAEAEALLAKKIEEKKATFYLQLVKEQMEA